MYIYEMLNCLSIALQVYKFVNFEIEKKFSSNDFCFYCFEVYSWSLFPYRKDC